MDPRFWIVPTLSALTLVALAAGGVLASLLLVPGWRRRVTALSARRPALLLLAALAVAATATGGSLYISGGMGLLPCELCWYQRIAMYPLVVILAVGLLRRDGGVWLTALPLALGGLAISAYHVLLQLVPRAQVTQCAGDVPCTARYFVAYGFISIPVMAGAAFLLIALLTIFHARGAVRNSVPTPP